MKNTENKTGRKIVFFLGAGASFGAGAFATVAGSGHIKIPTQANFWDVFLRFSKSPGNRKTIERFLFRYFLNYSRVPARAKAQKRRQMLSGIDVEEVFTFLSERIRSPASTPQLKQHLSTVWDALVAEIGPVFSKFPANTGTRRVYRKLHKKQIFSRDAVVSFNYDTIFEDSLPHGVKWEYEAINSSSTRKLQVLKPHGSANWDVTNNVITVKKMPRSAAIVAPTHLKFVSTNATDAPVLKGYLDQATAFTSIWTEMERHMTQAKALVFIGYSFPLADLYFSSLLRSVLSNRAKSPRIVIVNPDAVAISQRLEKRFALEKCLKFFDLEQFAGVSRKDLLARL